MSRELSLSEQLKIVERIIELRKRINLSRSAFALRCGYSSVHLMRVENLEYMPGEDLINRICQEFGVTEEWLLGQADTGPSLNAEAARNRVKQVRKERNIAIRDFAKSIHSSPSAVQAIEKGERELTLRYAQRIETVYHVGADWLLYGDESSKNYPCDENMLQYLKHHEELRQMIWETMQR